MAFALKFKRKIQHFCEFWYARNICIVSLYIMQMVSLTALKLQVFWSSFPSLLRIHVSVHVGVMCCCMCSCVCLVCVHHRQFRHCISCRINLVSQHSHQDQTFGHRPLYWVTGFQKTRMFLFIKKAATASVFISYLPLKSLSALLIFIFVHDVQSQSRWVAHMDTSLILLHSKCS